VSSLQSHVHKRVNTAAMATTAVHRYALAKLDVHVATIVSVHRHVKSDIGFVIVREIAYMAREGEAHAQGTSRGDSTDSFRPQGRLTIPTTTREAQEYAT
jgi:hypothetical protein